MRVRSGAALESPVVAADAKGVETAITETIVLDVGGSSDLSQRAEQDSKAEPGSSGAVASDAKDAHSQSVAILIPDLGQIEDAEVIEVQCFNKNLLSVGYASKHVSTRHVSQSAFTTSF